MKKLLILGLFLAFSLGFSQENGRWITKDASSWYNESTELFQDLLINIDQQLQDFQSRDYRDSIYEFRQVGLSFQGELINVCNQEWQQSKTVSSDLISAIMIFRNMTDSYKMLEYFYARQAEQQNDKLLIAIAETSFNYSLLEVIRYKQDSIKNLAFEANPCQ